MQAHDTVRDLDAPAAGSHDAGGSTGTGRLGAPAGDQAQEQADSMSSRWSGRSGGLGGMCRLVERGAGRS
jgi:hypothetical protein